MVSRVEGYGWWITFLVLIVLAVPWFLWGVDSIVAGLPVWVWWHISWMALASLCFWLFTRRAWGLGIEGIGG